MTLQLAPPDAARSAKVACAEADERSGRWDEAWTAYSEVLYDPDTPADVVVDAALGASRAAWQSSGAVDAAQILEVGLSRTESPTDRLPLLSARIHDILLSKTLRIHFTIITSWIKTSVVMNCWIFFAIRTKPITRIYKW